MNKTTKNLLLGAAVAGMLVINVPAEAKTKAKKAAAKKDEKAASMQCKGTNECKEKGACASASNACGGKNSCKEHVFNVPDEKTCTEKGGTVVKS